MYYDMYLVLTELDGRPLKRWTTDPDTFKPDMGLHTPSRRVVLGPFSFGDEGYEDEEHAEDNFAHDRIVLSDPDTWFD